MSTPGNSARVPSPRPRSIEEIPHLRGLPVLGNNIALLRDARAMVLDGRARHGDVFGVNTLGKKGIVFLHPDAFREVYLDRTACFSSERGWSYSIGPVFHGGLMLRDFDDHRLHRRVMQHAFRRSALTSYMTQINALAREHVRAAGFDGGSGVDMYQVTKRLTLDIACRVFLGLDLGPRADLVNACFVDMMGAAITPIRRPLPGTPMARGLKARARLSALLTDLADTRATEGPGEDLFSQLLASAGPGGQPLTVDEVVRHMMFLLLAAHDTTTATITVMLWHLAEEPAWQEHVADEVTELGGADVTIGNYADMVQTEWVMKEALRLNPPVPFSPREAVRDTDVMGVQIPAGGGVVLPSIGLHRHPDWWREPDRFDPMRFAPERAEDRAHSHLYVPFGGGAHLCLGLHLAELIVKAVLAATLADHRLATRPGRHLEMTAVPIPKPKRTVRLVLEPR